MSIVSNVGAKVVTKVAKSPVYKNAKRATVASGGITALTGAATVMNATAGRPGWAVFMGVLTFLNGANVFKGVKALKIYKEFTAKGYEFVKEGKEVILRKAK